ncbi:hypothetical protein WKW80_33030 [Variovorax humicola]|uniref:Uncharacterized protein n=1 Tax=Variovorax humicola TaxID=1769758 RepID=A0ABU8W9S6_9BURK
MVDLFNRLFVARDAYAPLIVESRTVVDGSRVGGAPPVASPAGMRFYLTIEGRDVDVRCAGTALSFFCDERDVGTIRLVVHASARSASPGRAITVGDLITERSGLPALPALGAMTSKIGGRPGYVQHELREDVGDLEFVFQWLEDSMPTDLPILIGDGAIYVFARRQHRSFDLHSACAFVQLG